MKKNKYLTILFGLILTFAAQRANAYDLSMSLGNVCEFVGKVQTNDSGKMNTCDFNVYVSSSLGYMFNEQITLSPEIGLFMPKNGRDSTISKFSFFALANAKYNFSMFHYLAGMGLYFTRTSGKGGTQDLNNGSTTVSFPMPNTATYSRNFIINMGLGVDFSKEWSMDLHTYVFNLATSEDRAFSIVLNGTYNFGEIK